MVTMTDIAKLRELESLVTLGTNVISEWVPIAPCRYVALFGGADFIDTWSGL